MGTGIYWDSESWTGSLNPAGPVRLALIPAAGAGIQDIKATGYPEYPEGSEAAVQVGIDVVLALQLTFDFSRSVDYSRRFRFLTRSMLTHNLQV